MVDNTRPPDDGGAKSIPVPLGKGRPWHKQWPIPMRATVLRRAITPRRPPVAGVLEVHHDVTGLPYAEAVISRP